MSTVNDNRVNVEVELDPANWTVTSGTWLHLLNQVAVFQIRVDHFNDLLQ